MHKEKDTMETALQRRLPQQERKLRCGFKYQIATHSVRPHLPNQKHQKIHFLFLLLVSILGSSQPKVFASQSQLPSNHITANLNHIHLERIMQETTRKTTTEDGDGPLYYYDLPRLQWMTSLGDETGLQRGNAIIQSPFNDDLLYITTQSGELFVRSAIDGSPAWSYNPILLDSTTHKDWTLHCKSSISFGELESVGKFLVYAVIAEPPETSSDPAFSHVIAISLPAHEIMWTSPEIGGKIQGTPVINLNLNDPRRKYVFLTSNTEAVDENLEAVTIGSFTILRVESGEILWSETEEEDPLGYSPIDIAQTPSFGKFKGGKSNDNDLLVWASSGDNGRGKNGFLYAFQFPPYYHESVVQLQLFSKIILKDVRWNTVSRPTLSENGLRMYVGVTGSQLRGWSNENNDFDSPADWRLELRPDQNDPAASISTPPVLSLDESRLFASSAASDMVCVNAVNGTVIWEHMGTSEFSSEHRVSPDDTRVYSIQSADGRIFCRNQIDGDLFWLVSCDFYEEDCANSILADFSISSQGQYLYYGDVTGRLVALKLGEYATPAPSTSMSVSTNSPTLAPVASPTNGPASSPTSPPDKAPTGGGIIVPQDPGFDPPPGIGNAESVGDGDDDSGVRRGLTVGGCIALILLATLVAVGASIYIFATDRLKTHPNPKPLEGPQCDMNTEDGAFADEMTYEDAPDPYEDSMISKLRAKYPKAYVPPPCPEDDGLLIDVHLYSNFDNDDDNSVFGSIWGRDSSDSSIHQADHIAQRLGTSNPILPRSSVWEDYAYGASLVL